MGLFYLNKSILTPKHQDKPYFNSLSALLTLYFAYLNLSLFSLLVDSKKMYFAPILAYFIKYNQAEIYIFFKKQGHF